MENVTESSSKYDNLEKMSISELLVNMNNEDKTVPLAVEKALPEIEQLVALGEEALRSKGRIFYIGAGTSGRLGIVDASECPPTFGVPFDLVVGLMAGGDSAIRKAVEFAEDDTDQGFIDLQAHNVSEKDLVIGIAASGRTPYVVGALSQCQSNNIKTGCITCNKNSPLSKVSDVAVEVVVGPEFVTGSTRLKAGTAQKLTLNLFSTCVMIRIGRVVGNKMVDMQLSNNKLCDRGAKMVSNELEISYGKAEKLLLRFKSVRKAIDAYRENNNVLEQEEDINNNNEEDSINNNDEN